MESTHTNFASLSNDEASSRINSVLKQLKIHGITTKNVQVALDYPYLSKARNFSAHKNRDTDLIGGRTMQDILESICTAYNLTFDEESKDFIFPKDLSPPQNVDSTIYYVLYFFMAPMFDLGKGILTFKGRKHSKLEVYDRGEHKVTWEGPYVQIGSYLFIEQDQINTGVKLKSLQTYVFGPSSRWRPICTGTYTAIRGKDGAPIAGKSIIEKVENRDAAVAKMGKPDDPRIFRYLAYTSVHAEINLIESLDDLAKDHETRIYEGEYSFYYKSLGGITRKGTIVLENNGQVKLDIYGSKYGGLYSLAGPRSIHIKIEHLNEGGHPTGLQASIYIPGNRPASRFKLLPGFGIGETNELPHSFPVLLVEMGAEIEDSKFHSSIHEFFEEYLKDQITGKKYFDLIRLMEDNLS